MINNHSQSTHQNCEIVFGPRTTFVGKGVHERCRVPCKRKDAKEHNVLTNKDLTYNMYLIPPQLL